MRGHSGLRMDEAFREVRQAIRALGRVPVAVLLSVGTLGVAIAAVTVVFSVIVALMLRGVPYRDPGAIVVVRPDSPHWDVFSLWRSDKAVFDEIAAYVERAANISGFGEPERMVVGRVTEGFFDVVGMRPAIGRAFVPSEFERGNDTVVLLTDTLWRTRYGRSADVIGRVMTIDDRQYTVIGVLPPGFLAPTEIPAIRPVSLQSGAAVLLPLCGDPRVPDSNRTDRTWRGMQVMARLRPGVTLEHARADLATIASRASVPREFQRDWTVVTVADYAAGDFPRQLPLLAFGVGVLVLVACANVGNLMLARGLSRRREMGTRMALGASRSALIRQMLTETTLIGLGAALVGSGVAWVGARCLVGYAGDLLTRMGAVVVLEPRVQLFTVAISFGIGILVGIIPAVQAGAVDPVVALRNEWRQPPTRGRAGLRGMLVAFQVSMSVLLLVSAALLGRDFVRLADLGLGFRPEGIVTADVSLSPKGYPTSLAVKLFFRELLERAAVLPDVSGVALASSPAPGGPVATVTNVVVLPRAGASHRGASPKPQERFEQCEIVAGDYFRLLSLAVRAGRGLDRRDTATSEPVVAVNEAFARQYWGDSASALDGAVLLGGVRFAVVGVIGDIRRADRISMEPQPMLYFSYGQFPKPPSQMTLFLASAGHEGAVTAGLRNLMAILDPSQPLYNVMTLERVVWAPLARKRLIAGLVGTFSVMALLVGAAGVYGATSCFVAERIHEMGIRLAVGGRPAAVVSLVIRRGMVPVLTGTVVGLLLAAAATPLVAAHLVGITATNPPTYLTVSLVIVAAGVVACAVPALRAGRANPMHILRNE